MRTVRLLLLVTLWVSIVGTLSELALLEHTEGIWQKVPMAMLGVGLVAILTVLILPSHTSIRALQVVMILFLFSGVLGVFLHYGSNVEFELEMYPDMMGSELFRESLKGAVPVLSPGVLAQTGLVGIAYAWLHPIARGQVRPRSTCPITLPAPSPALDPHQG